MAIGSKPAIERYDPVAITLHWVMAVGILVLLAMGIVMTQAHIAPLLKFKLYQLHKSIGITVLLAGVVRLLWRLGHRTPALPATMPPIERRAAIATHWVLYLFILALPLSGWAVVSASPLSIPTVLYGLWLWPHIPFLANLENKAPVEDALQWVHAIGAWLLCGVIALHLSAALRHRFILKDRVFDRMIYGRRVKLLLIGTALLPFFAVPARAMDWTLVPAQSSLGFTGTQVGAPFAGKFGRFSGTIDFDPAAPGNTRIRIVVDMASAETGDPQRDTAMPGGDWFDVAKFPQAVFEAKSARKVGESDYEAVGSLTIRGVTQPVTLPFHATVSGSTLHAAGKLDLRRNAYGIGQGNWNTEDWVAFVVGVTFDVTADRASRP